MYPVLLLFLLLAAGMNSGSLAFLREDNTGQKFVVAFPENIAYYYPDKAQNKIQITALRNNTNVSFTFQGNIFITQIMNIGESKVFNIYEDVELNKAEISDKTVMITSTRNITVRAISHKNSSVQTALVIPTDKLAKEYVIPSTPPIQGTTDEVEVKVTERNPFKLLIISVDQETKITIAGANTKEVSLAPLHVAQIWLHEADELRTVTADQPVAVLFGHPCAMCHCVTNCTCGILYNILPPAKQETVQFLIPPVLAQIACSETLADDKSFLLLSNSKSAEVVDFDPNSPLVESTGIAMFYRSGLLLPLIPEVDFASCFVVSCISGIQNFAVIVVHSSFTDGVRIGHGPPESPDWQELIGTEYVSIQVELEQETNVIWHNSSKMAVYSWGNNQSSIFGNPAAVISKIPDFRGCAMIPEVLKIGEVELGWPESLKYCKDNNMELASIYNAQLRRHIYKKIIQASGSDVQKVWIGMRRKSLTGYWHWLDNKPFNDTNWGDGEPGRVVDGQCGIMSLENGKWNDEDCCKPAHPFCYSAPVLLPLGPLPHSGFDPNSYSGSDPNSYSGSDPNSYSGSDPNSYSGSYPTFDPNFNNFNLWG